jgi:transcriptional regulator with XRE-family HTH domain
LPVDALGCSSARIKAYEPGERSPTLPEIELAAYYLQVLLSYFDEHAPGRGRQPVGDPQARRRASDRRRAAQQLRVVFTHAARRAGGRHTRHRRRDRVSATGRCRCRCSKRCQRVGIEFRLLRDGTDDIAE